jgi:hypothetical protein
MRDKKIIKYRLNSETISEVFLKLKDNKKALDSQVLF